MLKFQAALTALNLKAQADRETGDIHRTAIPHLVAVMAREELCRLFGETTAELAFGSMRADGTFPYKSVQPRIVHGVHDVDIGGAQFKGALDVQKIMPGDATFHVAVHVAIPFSRDTHREAADALAELLGEPDLEVSMQPMQPMQPMQQVLPEVGEP